jgi:hypothetical protein
MTVTTDDIQVALGRTSITQIEEIQWAMWIADARLLIEARLGDLDDLDQARLDYVTREAVVAHVRHPEDATQVSETVGDASTSKTYRSGKGRVVILEEWWALLAPTPTSGAFVVDTVGTSSLHLPWCLIYFGADYCSCGADIAGFPIYENLGQ